MQNCACSMLLMVMMVLLSAVSRDTRSRPMGALFLLQYFAFPTPTTLFIWVAVTLTTGATSIGRSQLFPTFSVLFHFLLSAKLPYARFLRIAFETAARVFVSFQDHSSQSF